MDKVITKAKGFRFCLNKCNMLDKMDLQLCIRYENTDIICKNVKLGKDFDISKRNLSGNLFHQFVNVTFSENKLRLLKAEN